MISIDNIVENLKEIRLLEDKLYHLELNGWLKNEFLTWEWWMLVGFLIVPWVIWVKLVKRNIILEILLFGTIIMMITTLLDVVGAQYSFWDYPIAFLPIIPWAFPFEMVPVAYMLLYQYFRTWKFYILAQVIMALTYAFIGEPFCEWFNLVNYVEWRYRYSFMYYIIVGIVTRAFILKLASLSKP
ncbi:CBO0543 family protein [Halalkalibacter krulwichiae]|uniref:CBO0543 family protein n=1 Tax=Halalkalibacter krulwichiae TaxID=199441 RepID=UPI000A19FA6D|nr:CBO0543 family protein [Halalkalibacter krulwichiae]